MDERLPELINLLSVLNEMKIAGVSVTHEINMTLAATMMCLQLPVTPEELKKVRDKQHTKGVRP